MNMKQLLTPVALIVSLAISSFTTNASIVHDNEVWTLQGTLGKSIPQVEVEQAGSQWVLPDLNEVRRLLVDRGLRYTADFVHDIDSKVRLLTEGLGSTQEGFWGLAREYKHDRVYLVSVTLRGDTYLWRNQFIRDVQYSGPSSAVFLKTPHVPAPVPVPSAVWLFGSGIMGLIARRKLGE